MIEVGEQAARLDEIADRCRVIAVLVIEDPSDAAPVASALLEGGVYAVELTLRTDAAFQALGGMLDRFPELTVGVGTVLTEEQVRRVADSGAAFGVSPGCNPIVVKAAQNARLPFAPGVATPSDIEQALQLGLRTMKFFPAEPMGGLPYLESAAAPYKHLGPQFIPLGGIGASNARAYLESPLVSAIGGSWIAPKQDIREKKWELIRQRASQAREMIDSLPGR